MIQIEKNKLTIEIYTNNPAHALYAFQQALLQMLCSADSRSIENHAVEYTAELLKELSLECDQIENAFITSQKAS